MTRSLSVEADESAMTTGTRASGWIPGPSKESVKGVFPADQRTRWDTWLEGLDRFPRKLSKAVKDARPGRSAGEL